MRTRSGKQLHDAVEAPKRKRNSVAESAGEPSHAQQPSRKRQKKSEANSIGSKALPVQTTLQHDDAIAITDESSVAPNKTLPVQSTSQPNASIVTSDGTTTSPLRKIPGPTVEKLLEIVRDVSLSSYTCFTVRTYLQSRSRAFRKLCQKDAEHQARLVIQELEKLGVISNCHVAAQNDPEDDVDGNVHETRQNPNVEGDDEDDSRYAIGRRSMKESKRIRSVAPQLSAELILQGKEEQEDNSDVRITHVRSTSTRPKQVGLPSDSPAPLDNHHTSRGTEMGSEKATTSHYEVEERSREEKHLNNRDLRKEQEERALAMRQKAMEISRTARGAIMFTVAEAVQFLADFDENIASTSVMADEIQVGEFLPYPVQKPYHLGAMGRYGKETFVSDIKRTTAPSDPLEAAYVPRFGLDGSADAPALDTEPQPTPPAQASRHNKYRMPTGPYAGYTFKSVPHSYLRLLQANPVEFEQYEGLREVFDSCWPTGMPDPSPATYRFNFGPHFGKRLDDVPEEYRSELEASEEVKHPKSRQFKNLRAAFNYRKWKDDTTNNAVATSISSNMATSATDTAVASTAKPRVARSSKTNRGHKPFVFQHGRWAGVNIDTVPKYYLLQLQEHPDELAKHQGLDEILQLRFPNGLRRQADYKLKSGPYTGKTLDEVPESYVAELNKTATAKTLKRALKYYFREKEKRDSVM